MISSFSDAEYLMCRAPHPRSCFFEQAVFEGQLGDQLFHVPGVASKSRYLNRRSLPGGIARKPLLPGLQELFRLTVIQALGDPFTSAQLGDAVLATQADRHDPHLLFSGILLKGATADIPNRLLCSGLSGV
jgi:hypothetical protein